MSPRKKARIVYDMFEFGEQLAIADIRAKYPNADERELRLRCAARRIPRELMIHAFGWDVKEHGY